MHFPSTTLLLSALLTTATAWDVSFFKTGSLCLQLAEQYITYTGFITTCHRLPTPISSSDTDPAFSCTFHMAGETTSQCVGVEPFVPSSFSTGRGVVACFIVGCVRGIS
jgi:hypothetical protein